MHSLLDDARYAVRMLVKRPGFAAIAIFTLALGIGATTAIFTVVEAVLLRPLPFADPGRLVQLTIRGADGESYPLPDTDFLAWRAQHEAFDAIAVYDNGQALSLTGDGQPERIIAANVTDGFFTTLGVAPAAGRVFQAGDDAPGAPKTVVLSHGFWQKRFHGDPGVIGRTVMLDATTHTIVGVMPASFAFPGTDLDAWRILTMAPPARRGPFYTTGVGRLKRGATLQQARANVDVVAAGLKREHAGPNAWRFSLVPLHDAVVGDVRRILYLLFGAVGFLLLIATANVANLLLARAASRQREIAVRGALGAGRARIVAQLVTESVVLAVLAGALALAVAAVGTRALIAIAPEGIPRIGEVGMNVPVFAFTLAVATMCGLAFGIVPASRVSRTPLVEALKEGGRGGTASAGHRRIQRALVVAEIALALMLSVGAGLMIRSVAALARVNPGFAPSHLLTFQLSLPQARYETPQKVAAFYDTLQPKLEALPSVQSVGYAVSLPPDVLSMTDNFMVEGQTLPPNQSAPVAPLLFVNDEYFKTLGVPLVAGRFFNARDTLDAPGVVIVNETLARRFFPGVDPVGRRLKDGGPERPIGPNNPWMTVVGVVGDVKYSGLDAAPEPAFYLSYRQNPQTRRFVVLRSASDPKALVQSIRTAVNAVDRDLPFARVWTIDELMTLSMAAPKFRTTLVSVFALVGLMLAAIGIYGVMAYAVAERTHELGLRVALGATTGDVMRLVLREALVLSAAGLAIGLGGAFATTRLMGALLFGVAPTDLTTFASMAAAIVATALVASYVPARRAMGVDPMVALRYE
jgi:putative ABC transport system permease protein